MIESGICTALVRGGEGAWRASSTPGISFKVCEPTRRLASRQSYSGLIPAHASPPTIILAASRSSSSNATSRSVGTG